ncbi:MAG TPA: hypothetical protein VFG68_09545 [Fimbriiglobus sp.]|nr:hypothetical protein [Fimbriiglobus sp.]
MPTRPPTPSARRAACAALAVAFLAASLGLPLPARSSGPSPSPGRACGCPAERVLSGTCCCSTRSAVKSCCAAKPAGRRGNEPPRVTWVLAWQAAECRGLGPGGLLVPPPGLPPAPPVVIGRWPDPGDAVLAATDRPLCVPLRPPTPPPKLA